MVQQFAQMLRTRTGEYLDAWLEQARVSQMREVQSLVLGIERDKAAVFAGLSLPQSNGIVEGKVNKLKLIKRMGDGRAGFPLLRQRVLHALERTLLKVNYHRTVLRIRSAESTSLRDDRVS